MPRALVLGAGGFIGRGAVEALRAAGFDVVPASRSGRGPMDRDGVRINLLADDGGRLASRLRSIGPDVVVNAAGRTLGSAVELLAGDVVATAQLLEAVAAAGASSPLPVRFVQVGSAAEYGEGPTGIPVTEEACPRPVAPYGVAKLAATQLVLAAAAAGRVDGIVLRVFNALGPGMPAHSLPGAAIDRIRAAVESGASTIEMGPLDAVRDFVDLRDVGRAIAAASAAPRIEAALVNVGSGTGHPARALVQALADRLGFRGSIHEGARGSSRSSGVPWQVADVSLARRVFGWEPRHDLEATVSWLVEADAPPAPSGPAPGG